MHVFELTPTLDLLCFLLFTCSKKIEMWFTTKAAGAFIKAIPEKSAVSSVSVNKK